MTQAPLSKRQLQFQRQRQHPNPGVGRSPVAKPSTSCNGTKNDEDKRRIND